VAVDATNGDTKASDILSTTRKVIGAAVDHGLSPVIGVGDGAQPMRSTTLKTMYHSGDVCGGYITIPHRWIVLAVPLWDGSGWYIVTSDFMVRLSRVPIAQTPSLHLPSHSNYRIHLAHRVANSYKRHRPKP